MSDDGELTHWGRDKKDAILQMTFSNAFILEEKVWFPFKISLWFVPKRPNSNIGSDNGLAPSRRQVIIWTNDG